MAEWTHEWLGSKVPDVFAEPAQGTELLWSTLPVSNILITFGDEEVFYDQDLVLADKLSVSANDEDF